MGRTRFDASRAKHAAVKAGDADGTIADNMTVRLALIDRMNAGELTLDQVQDELKKIKRNAKKNGQITRAQAFSRG
jgi:hypothetical protein